MPILPIPSVAHRAASLPCAAALLAMLTLFHQHGWEGGEGLWGGGGGVIQAPFPNPTPGWLP